MRAQHPSIEHLLEGQYDDPFQDVPERNDAKNHQTTSLSLARALAIGCLGRLDSSLKSVNVWDPAMGTGYAGHMLVTSLRAAGIEVQYRGQDIDTQAVATARLRFDGIPGSEFHVANTLEEDKAPDFEADLVIVDAPWDLDWRGSAKAVERRHQEGAFRFGLPATRNSSWLFISLALEKLRPETAGGGRVAALVTPNSLRSGGGDARIRREILEAGLLESITRLPEGLAPNTNVPLYLLTFANGSSRSRQDTSMIADLRTQFTRSGRHRSMTPRAFRELESGLRTGKSGPRNRHIRSTKFTRRDAKLVRCVGDGRRFSWRLSTFNDTAIDAQYLESRYGSDSGVEIEGTLETTVEFDPSRHFDDDSRDILKDLQSKKWQAQRLSMLLVEEPVVLASQEDSSNGNLFIPVTRNGAASTTMAGTRNDGRVISVQIDEEAIQPEFLVAWLNSEYGESSRRRAIETGSTGALVAVLRTDPNSLMRWADELIVPKPSSDIQLSVIVADEMLATFQVELGLRRASLWSNPDSADELASGLTEIFDDSLSSWYDQLPYPIATALWVAETAEPLGEKQDAYMRAWESIVAFHATVLLSACRCIPGGGAEAEVAIRRTLESQGLSIERATWGTWIVIVEKVSSTIREALNSDDRDEIARVRKAFGGLDESGIAKLVSKEIIGKFKELNSKRNSWDAHSGYTSDEKKKLQIDVLVADLRELRGILGNVWTQLSLVRAGSVERNREGFTQTAELALGMNSPFRKKTYRVGDPMMTGELYLVKDGSESPLQLLQFVQLRTAPSGARYTTYFYNRTEGNQVRLVSYQYGSESEVREDAASYRQEFGVLIDE